VAEVGEDQVDAADRVDQMVEAQADQMGEDRAGRMTIDAAALDLDLLRAKDAHREKGSTQMIAANEAAAQEVNSAMIDNVMAAAAVVAAALDMEEST
jgi:hypothetical protein